jgi:hypothetical protein
LKGEKRRGKQYIIISKTKKKTNKNSEKYKVQILKEIK